MSTYIYFLFLKSSCKIGNYKYLEVQSDVYRKTINSMHNIEFPITNKIKIHLPASFSFFIWYKAIGRHII